MIGKKTTNRELEKAIPISVQDFETNLEKVSQTVHLNVPVFVYDDVELTYLEMVSGHPIETIVISEIPKRKMPIHIPILFKD